MITSINEFRKNESNITENIDTDIFILDTEFPFGLPEESMDFYVKRKDGKTGASNWDDFKDLVISNPGIKFGTYANSSYVNIFQSLQDGRILVMKEVHIINNI